MDTKRSLERGKTRRNVVMKATIKKISLFMLSLAVVLTMAASTGMNSEAASKKPTKITLKATSKTVDIKGKVKVCKTF